jgi:hypothetical protein
MMCYPPEFVREARVAMYVEGRQCSGRFELCTSACKQEVTRPEQLDGLDVVEMCAADK